MNPSKRTAERGHGGGLGWMCVATAALTLVGPAWAAGPAPTGAGAPAAAAATLPAAEQVGTMLIDAKGNRVVAESLRAAPLVIVVRATAPASEVAALLGEVARDPQRGTRVEFVAVDAGDQRDGLLRLLRAANLHWYGVEPGSAAARAWADRMATCGTPGLLALDRSGREVGRTGTGSATPTPGDLLRAVGLAAATPPAPAAPAAPPIATAPSPAKPATPAPAASLTDEALRARYPLEGVIQYGASRRAMLGRRVVGDGDMLQAGVKVVRIEDKRVILAVEDREVELFPAPIHAPAAPAKP